MAKIALSGTEYTFELNDRIADEFCALLPFDTSVSRSGGHHYWGSIPQSLSTPDELRTSRPKKGGLYYADHLTALAIYYGDPGSIAPFVVYHLGDAVEDLSGLATSGSRITLTARP
jgi:hypothetical protein